MNETAMVEKSINWVTHQKCKDMFILSKVGKKGLSIKPIKN